MTVLAQRYLLGDLVDPDAPLALALLQRAAGLGDARAMDLLGRVCAMGLNVEQDLAGAELWLLKAIDAGYAEAEERLMRIRVEREAA